MEQMQELKNILAKANANAFAFTLWMPMMEDNLSMAYGRDIQYYHSECGAMESIMLIFPHTPYY